MPIRFARGVRELVQRCPELDLDELQRNRPARDRIGAFAFSSPFVRGLVLVLPFASRSATAALYG